MEKRTTVVADAEDLALLARAARADGRSLGRALGELVAQRASELRQQRRPRTATFRADVGIAASMEAEDPAAADFRD